MVNTNGVLIGSILISNKELSWGCLRDKHSYEYSGTKHGVTYNHNKGGLIGTTRKVYRCGFKGSRQEGLYLMGMRIINIKGLKYE